MWMALLCLLLLCSHYAVAQDGGCNPSPPSTLFSSGPPEKLYDNKVPKLNAQPNILQPIIGGQRTDIWAMFSAAQLRQHGLWCQVREEDTNNMPNDNVGNWYYPSTDGYTLLTNTTTDGTPYQSLKCTNQIGLVVDGDLTNYQGIVKCNTTLSNLHKEENYFAVYTNKIFNNYSGPIVDPTMNVSILSLRDSDSNVVFTLTFNVMFGPPSHVYCAYNGQGFFSSREHPHLSRKVIRSQYLSSSQPDMTRVTLTVEQPIKEGRTYACAIIAEGRTHIVSSTEYNYFKMGTEGISTVDITVAGTPTAVAANRTGYNSFLFFWATPSPPPAGYELFYQSTAVGSRRLSGGNTSNTELTLSGLTLEETYMVFVVAFGAEGAPVLPSSHSNSIALYVPIPQMSEMILLNSNASSVTVSWKSTQFAPDLYNISFSCQLLCSLLGNTTASSIKTVLVNGAVNIHTISSVNAGSNCMVSVTAVFGSSTSNTITSSTNTTSAAPTGAPVRLVITSVESRSLSLVWTAVPCSHQGGPITGYIIQYSNTSGSYIVNIAGEENRQFNLTNKLTPFTSYSVQVAAVNDGGTGQYSNLVYVMKTLQDVPGPIYNLSAFPEVVHIEVLWVPPLEPNGVIITNEICSNVINMHRCINISATQHTLRNLPPNTAVTFSVRAYTIIGPGEYVTGHVSTKSVPIVSGVSVIPLSDTKVNVSWTPVNLTVVDHYTVHYVYTTMGGVSVSVIFSSNTSSGVVSGLQGGQQYQFSVTVTLNVSGQLFKGLPQYTLPPITLPSLLESTLFAAGAIVVVLFFIIIAIVLFVFFRKRRSSGVFAVRYLKDRSIDQTIANHGECYTILPSCKPFIEEFPDDKTVVEGNKVLLPVNIIGLPQPTFTWYHDNTCLGDDNAHEISNNGSLTIMTAKIKDSGTYRLMASNSEGTVEKQLSLKVVTERYLNFPLAVPAKSTKTKPVSVDELGRYVSHNHANANKGFKMLYNSLDSGEIEHPVTVGLTAANKPLNRFNNITVYDHDRVILQPLSGYCDCQSDYINASYIDGYEKQCKYIACQAPLPKTLVDFWRMIWQDKVYVVAMVTNLKENNKTKCHQYWPESGSKSYGPFTVTITDQQVYADFTVRILQLQLKGGSELLHVVTQYHFTSWIDHNVPDGYATSLLTFHHHIKQVYNPSQGPLVVHCSAGVGRTGTFIAIDILLEQVEKEKIVDVSRVINKMRHQRMKMVQTASQFAFIHDVLLESVTCGDTWINSNDLQSTTIQLTSINYHTGKNGYETQFETLNQVSPSSNDVKTLAAIQHGNKNRSMKFLPPDKYRVKLKGNVPDYIHATFVNGYNSKKAFIVAQSPMESTSMDFWMMIMERECTVIVMLCGLKENEQEVCHQYWPAPDEKKRYGELLVQTTLENNCDGYTERILSIIDKHGKCHEVTQFHITNWNPEGTCSNPQTIITVMEEVYMVQRRTDNKHIVIHCSDTVSRSGMFCAIATTIDRCKSEGIVDVFQVVKSQRIQRPGLILTVEQYRFVFEAVLIFLESFETYSNFK